MAASSYQNDGRPAPAKLTVAAKTATISGSSSARGGVAIRRLGYPLSTSPWCQNRSAVVLGPRFLTRLPDFVRGRPRLSRVVAHQRCAHASDFDVVGLLSGTDFPVGMLLRQVVQLVNGGLAVGDK